MKPGDGLWFTPFLAIVTLIVMGGALWLVLNPAVAKQRALRGEIRRVDSELAQLQQRSAELQSRRNTLLYNGEALEREARRQLGYVRPGEVGLIPTAPFDISTRIDESRIPALICPAWITLGMKIVLALLALSLVALAAGCVFEGAPRTQNS